MAKRPTSQKRAGSNTADKSVEIMQNALKKIIAPPKHVTLRKADVPFWNSLMRARARELWTDADLENAANIARCKSDIERLQKEIDKEGDVIENKRGTMIVNPKHQLLETLSRRAAMLSRMIHVHAEATIGTSRESAEALAAENQARSAVDDVSEDVDDGLIPTAAALH